jgi:hypothetical protein
MGEPLMWLSAIVEGEYSWRALRGLVFRDTLARMKKAQSALREFTIPERERGSCT